MTLRTCGFQTLDDVLQISKADFYKNPGLGDTIFDDIKMAVEAAGYELPTVSAQWVPQHLTSWTEFQEELHASLSSETAARREPVIVPSIPGGPNRFDEDVDPRSSREELGRPTFAASTTRSFHPADVNTLLGNVSIRFIKPPSQAANRRRPRHRLRRRNPQRRLLLNPPPALPSRHEPAGDPAKAQQDSSPASSRTPFKPDPNEHLSPN